MVRIKIVTTSPYGSLDTRINQILEDISDDPDFKIIDIKYQLTSFNNRIYERAMIIFETSEELNKGE